MKLFHIFGSLFLVSMLVGCEDTTGNDGEGEDSQNSSYSQNDGGDSSQDQGGDYGDEGGGYGDSGGGSYGDKGRSYYGDDDEDSEGWEVLEGEEENYNHRFKILGDLNSTINGITYNQKTAIDYKSEAYPSGYRYDMIEKNYHIQLAGYSIEGDFWNQSKGSVLLKFNLPTMETTGMFPLRFPYSQDGMVNIISIIPSVNDTYLISGYLTTTGIQTRSGGASLSASFSSYVVPLYK